MNSQTIYRAMVEAQSLIRNEGRGADDPRGMNRRFRQAHTFEEGVLSRLGQRDSLAGGGSPTGESREVAALRDRGWARMNDPRKAAKV